MRLSACLLYRLSISPHADQFLLKGALLFDLWFDIPHRPTRDADFLGFGSAELPHLEAVFKDVCAMETDDGVTFRPDTVQAAEIRMSASGIYRPTWSRHKSADGRAGSATPESA